MKIIEKFSGVFLIAGIFLLLSAMLSLGIVPALMVDKLNPGQGLPLDVPDDFKIYYASTEAYHAGILRGRDLYIREACWHCHSQYVRPVSNENLMYGPVSTAGEMNSVLHKPQLLGTRRVGPDLSREAGKHSNDWQFAHLYKPTNVVPESVMPSYTWYFKNDKDGTPQPTEDGIALIAYIQQLGWQMQDRSETQYDVDKITTAPTE